MRNTGLKVLAISVEITALLCLALLLFISAKNSQDFDFVRAFFCFMFAIVAVVFQSMQDDIKWNYNGKQA